MGISYRLLLSAAMRLNKKQTILTIRMSDFSSKVLVDILRTTSNLMNVDEAVISSSQKTSNTSTRWELYYSLELFDKEQIEKLKLSLVTI